MNLLLTGAFNYSKEQLKQISSMGYEITFIQDERIKLKIDLSGFEAVVCNNLFLYNDIHKFKKLKFIQLTSAGLDRVPIEYIYANNIRIENARGVYSVPMAEWVVLKILEIYKNSKKFYQLQNEHKWEKQRDIIELTEKTVAIIGFGSVGKEVAKRLRAFDVYIIGVDIGNVESELVNEYQKIDLIDKVIERSDIVILTLPLTDETIHLINKDKIEKMKENCVLVNVSRGDIIDQDALIDALEAKKFLGVALDVFEEEPLSKDNRLWNINNTIITPHNSFISEKTNERLYSKILLNLQYLKDN